VQACGIEPDVGTTKKVMLKQVERAALWVGKASTATSTKKQESFLENAVTALEALGFRAPSLRGRKTIGANTRVRLQMLTQSALSDTESLAKTL
jgi:hypothetical protein